MLEAVDIRRFKQMAVDLPKFRYAEMEHARDPKIYRAPMFMVQQSLQDDRLVGATSDQDIVYSRTYFGVPAQANDRWRLDLTNSFLNSSLATYCFFMTATRFGIDKQIAEQNDFNRLPFRNVDSASECKELRNLLRKLETQDEPDLNLLDEAIFDFYEMPIWKREYVTDTLRFDFDFVRHGSNSPSVLPAEANDLRLYADTMVKFIRSNLSLRELSVNTDIVTGISDFRCVVIRFDEDRNRGVRFTSTPEDNFSSRLAELLHAPLTSGVQLRRSLIHFDEDRCLIVKLAQKRFWSRARAYDDADSIFDEFCRGGE